MSDRDEWLHEILCDVWEGNTCPEDAVVEIKATGNWQAARRWRPIEEAPKDGTSVLIGRPGTSARKARWVEMKRVPDRWETPGLGRVHFEPTHFQHLPEPPNE